MNRLILALIITLMTLPQPVYAGDTAEASNLLSQQMRQHQVVKGHFEQSRTLTGIPRPIHSSGRFIYWRNHGLYWKTEKPISQASTFTPDAIIHWQSGTDLQQAKRQVNKSTSPVQKQISRILLAVFGGDIQSLEKLFNTHWHSGSTPGEKQWTVDLTPSVTAIKQAVEKITLSGGDYVNNLNLDASNGDTTRIHFSNIRAFTYPAADDCQYFNQDSASCPGDKTGTLSSSRREP